MPIAPLLQNVIGALHNVPRHGSQSHPACIRTLNHRITILFGEQQIVQPRVPAAMFPKRSSNRWHEGRATTGIGKYKLRSNVRSPTTACHVGS